MAVLADDNIVVADSGNHRLQVLTPEGAFVSSVGSKGSKPLQFIKGHGVWQLIAMFITEMCNHRVPRRVQVLNPDLTYLRCFGKKGTQPGECNTPYGIALDADGMVYVADYCNNRVQKRRPSPSGGNNTVQER